MVVSEFESYLFVSGRWKELFAETSDPSTMPTFSFGGAWTYFVGGHIVSGRGILSLHDAVFGEGHAKALEKLSKKFNTPLEMDPLDTQPFTFEAQTRDAYPHPSLEPFVREILASVKSPRTNFAIGAALVAISALMAGCYVSPDSDGPLQLYYLVHAKAAGGKGSYGTIPTRILQLVDKDLLEYVAMAAPSSQQALLNEFEECNKRLIESPEAGEFFESLMDKRSIIYAMRSKLRSAWNSERILGTSTKAKKDSCPTCDYPVLLFWCAMTATQAKETMEDRNTATDGFLSRLSFLTTKETGQNSSSRPFFLSAPILDALKALAWRTIMAIEHGVSNAKTEKQDKNESGRNMQIRISLDKRIKIGKQAWDFAKELEKKCQAEVKELEDADNDVMASLVGRLYEKAMRVATLVAAFEGALYKLPEDEWEVDLSHLQWGYNWERMHVDNLREVSAIASEESEHARLKKSIILAIDSIAPEKRSKDGWIQYSEMRRTNKGNMRKAKPAEIQQALLDLEESGKIEAFRDESNRKVKAVRKK
jgi:hypothetical protein